MHQVARVKAGRVQLLIKIAVAEKKNELIRDFCAYLKEFNDSCSGLRYIEGLQYVIIMSKLKQCACCAQGAAACCYESRGVEITIRRLI